MTVTQIRILRLIFVIALCGTLFFGGKYILPLVFPFLLGFLLAYMAEPGVKRLAKRMGRTLAAGIGVSISLIIVTLLLAIFGGILVRQLGKMTRILPDLEAAALESGRTLENFLLDLAGKAPAGVRNLLRRGVLALFGNGNLLLQEGLAHLPRVITGVLSHLPGGFITLGTGVLSAYLISARLPKLRAMLPGPWMQKVLPVLRNIKNAVLGWLVAQMKLAALTFLVCLWGLLILGVPYGAVWAAVIAVVDAVPMLGSGLVLVPWSVVSFLSGRAGEGIGLLITFAAAFLLRTVLEPRLVGKQMGLDPLLTLVALYLGFQLGGVWGLIFAPILAVTAMELTKPLL
jgi:sporulation integral membrane protein YtvI